MKLRMSGISAILLFLVLSNSVYGKTIDVSGVVVGCCGEPLKDALIEIPNSDISCKTDSLGKFRLYGTGTKKVLHSTISVQYDKIEYFNLHGRRMSEYDNKHINGKQSGKKYLTNNCVIVRLTGDRKQSETKIVPFSNYRNNGVIKTKQSDIKLGKEMLFQDSLRVSKAGFRTRIVTFDSGNDTADDIALAKIVDEFSDCGKIKTQSDSAKSFGYRVLKDSLLLSQAKFEWSARKYSVPVNGSKSRCVIDISPWGLYSRYTVQGNSGSYSTISNGYVVSTGLQSVSPVLTITGQAGGLELANGSTIDKSCQVVLFNGSIRDAGGYYHNDPPAMLAVRPRLPFDSLLLRTLFQIKSAEYEGYFKDSAVMRNDTLIVKGSDQIERGNAKIINSPLIISGTVSDASITTSGTLILKTGSIIRNSLIMAANVVIQGGNTDGSVFYSFVKVTIDYGTHNSQFYAYDSIIVGQNVKTSPASLWVIKKTLQNDACIYFRENKAICGTAISFRDTWFSYPNISISLDSGSVFTGYLITDGAVQAKYVDITGSIYSSSIESIIGKVSYLNWLHGISLHAPKTPLTFPLIGRDPINLNFIESTTTSVCY